MRRRHRFAVHNCKHKIDVHKWVEIQHMWRKRETIFACQRTFHMCSDAWSLLKLGNRRVRAIEAQDYIVSGTL